MLIPVEILPPSNCASCYEGRGRRGNNPLTFSLKSIGDFVAAKSLGFRVAFDAEPMKAKEILARHVPISSLRQVYEVSGDIDLFRGERR